MKIMAVDDERLALQKTLRQVRSLDSTESAEGFTDPYSALEWLRSHRVDAALLDIEMFGMNGIQLAKACKDIQPDIRIIFVTGYSEYALDAFRLHASGYLLKPVSTKDMKAELEALELPPKSVPRQKGVCIQTFGNFEVFVDGTPVIFRRTKSKELLAYLVDRKGAGLTIAEIAATLWEDRPYERGLQNQVQMIVSEMMRALKDVGADQIVIKRRNLLAVDPSSFSCDYYRFLDGDIVAINSFLGEYMSNYSWAEFTTGLLEQKSL